MTDYVSSYVQQALQDPATLKPPDPTKANGQLEVLESLYLERNSGLEAVRKAWDTIKRLRPELASLTSKKRQQLINFRELKDRKPPTYALGTSLDGDAPPYAIYLNGMNMMYGDRGTGKTFITLDFACRLALGNPNKHVIYTAGEGISGLYGRLRAWELHYHQTVSNLMLWENALQAMNTNEVAAFISDIEQNNYKPIMIIVDTMARAAKGLNENDTRDMVIFMDAYEQLVERLGCGVLFIHHVNRMGGIRGSSVFDGALDSMLKVVSSDGRITVYNRYDKGGKNKHREEGPDLQFVILPVTVDELMDMDDPGAEKQAIATTVDNVLDDPSVELRGNQKRILEALQGHEAGLSAQAIADAIEIGRATVYRNVNKLIDTGYIKQNSTTSLYVLTSAGQERLG